MLRISVVRAAFICIFLLFSCAVRQQPPLQPVVLPENIPFVDSKIVFGELSNGFQYILQKNTTPKDRVSVHLDVLAGSMQETEEQQGLAHFLEHMLFNGSEHFAPGELARYFPSIGMDFGADANAHTTFFNTVYDLDLPSGDTRQMDEAFVIIQDYAKGALLLGTEIEKERGIILAEKRERDSVSYRTFKKTLEFELPDSRFIKRFPIGIEEVIRHAGWPLLKSFYDTWYRPENMVLVVVGDFDVERVLQMIVERFSKLRARAPLPDLSIDTRWTPHEGVKTFYHHEPEAGSTDVTIETIRWEPFQPMSEERLKEQTLIHLANSILRNRLSRMVLKQTADFSDSSVFSGRFLHHVGISVISATCEPGKWQRTLEQIENVLRQGVSYGFNTEEMERVKADYISMLERGADQSETRKTPDIAKRILATVNSRGLLLSPEKRAEILVPYVKTLTAEDAAKILRKIWSENHRLLLVTGNADISSPDPEKAIRKVYEKGHAKPVSKYEEMKNIAFPYLEQPVGSAGIKNQVEDIEGLGITVVELDNKVHLNIKQTDFEKNEFLFRVDFGFGRASEPKSRPGLRILAEDVVESSGLGQMDNDQLGRALAGKKINMSFNIGDNSLMIGGSADPAEMPLVFDLIRHSLNDPGFRQETLELSKSRYRQMYNEMIRTVRGANHIKASFFLAGNDPRFGLPHPDLLDTYTLDDIKEWLMPEFKSAPVEISVVGDLNVGQVVSLAQKYAVGLGMRDASFDVTESADKIGFPAGRDLEIDLDTKIESGAVHVAFLTDDFWDIRQTRRLSILARVFEERLRFLIREELGESYSPYVYNEPSTLFEGYGLMHVMVNVGPGRHEAVYRKISEIVNSMIDKQIQPEETALALKPVLKHLDTFHRTNRYWLNSVMANSSRFPQKFEWAGTLLEDYARINKNDMNRLADKYLKMGKSVKIFIKAGKDLNKRSD